MSTRVKVCCISSRDEADLAIRAGASALGLVSEMPSGPGVIGEELIGEIADMAPPGVATFLLTSATTAEAIVAQHGRCRTNTIQLCDRIELAAVRRLRAALPAVKLVQVVHVEGSDAVAESLEVAPHVDAILLDSGRPGAAVKELGGTGRIHDWEISARIVRAIAPRPLYLAGGLRPDNVGDAVAHVAPFALDLCSGVRRDGRLDAALLHAFMGAVRSADAARG